jgi:uncharacterized protein
MKMDAYTIVVLRRPASAPQLSEAELDVLQAEHVAFNGRMREAGHALINGPFMDQPDQSWRGVGVYRTSVEETRRLLAADPLGKAGRLTYDVFTWLMPAGTLGDRPASQIEVG